MELSKSPIFIATILAISVSFLSAFDGIIVRILTDELHPFLIVFYRSLFGLILIGEIIRRSIRSVQDSAT